VSYATTTGQAAKNEVACKKEQSVIKLRPKKPQATAVANLCSAPAYCFEWTMDSHRRRHQGHLPQVSFKAACLYTKCRNGEQTQTKKTQATAVANLCSAPAYCSEWTMPSEIQEALCKEDRRSVECHSNLFLQPRHGSWKAFELRFFLGSRVNPR